MRLAAKRAAARDAPPKGHDVQLNSTRQKHLLCPAEANSAPSMLPGSRRAAHILCYATTVRVERSVALPSCARLRRGSRGAQCSTRAPALSSTPEKGEPQA